MQVSRDPVQKLIFELGKLPGIGEKTAARLAYYILKQDPAYASSLSDAIVNARQKTTFCKQCFLLTNEELCRFCADPARDPAVLCVVERPSDAFSIENSVAFKGLYHVLHGVISPLDGIGPDDLKIRELLRRLESGAVREVILATNPSVEGEATSLYLSKLLKTIGVRVTKLAYGLPVGGRLEFSDGQTISKALQNRTEL